MERAAHGSVNPLVGIAEGATTQLREEYRGAPGTGQIQARRQHGCLVGGLQHKDRKSSPTRVLAVPAVCHRQRGTKGLRNQVIGLRSFGCFDVPVQTDAQPAPKFVQFDFITSSQMSIGGLKSIGCA